MKKILHSKPAVFIGQSAVILTMAVTSVIVFVWCAANADSPGSAIHPDAVPITTITMEFFAGVANLAKG